MANSINTYVLYQILEDEHPFFPSYGAKHHGIPWFWSSSPYKTWSSSWHSKRLSGNSMSVCKKAFQMVFRLQEIVVLTQKSIKTSSQPNLGHSIVQSQAVWFHRHLAHGDHRNILAILQDVAHFQSHTHIHTNRIKLVVCVYVNSCFVYLSMFLFAYLFIHQCIHGFNWIYVLPTKSQWYSRNIPII